MNLDLAGKVAVVTGGNIGIGLAIARGLAEEGVHIALSGRNEDRIAESVREITETYGVNAIGMKVDVTQPAEIDRFVGAIDATFGGADILINNAGAGSEETIMGAPDEKWQYYWDLHVMAAIRLTRSLVPMMRQRGGGVILNNASICATQPMAHEPIYNTTKAALVMLSKCLEPVMNYRTKAMW